MLVAKSFQRALGLISIIVLARLLTPEDFVVVAISALVLYFCDALSTSGSEPYLIRKTAVSDADASSAWTLDIALKGAVFVALNLAAPWIADAYEDDRLAPVLHVVSFTLLLNAVRSPGLFLLKRALKYGAITRLLIFQKLVAFVVTLSIAAAFQSYWALVIGDLVAALVMAIGSYLVHPFRPGFTCVAWREQWWFSRWLLLKTNIGYAKAQVDVFFVTRLFSDEAVGAFYLTRNLSVIPSNDVIWPAVEPLLVPLSKNRDRPDIFRLQLQKVLLAVALLAIPITVFMAAQPEAFIDFMFGRQWVAAYSLLPPLMLVFFTMAFSQILTQVFTALGRVKALMVFEAGSLLMLIMVLFWVRNSNIEEFVTYRAWLAVALVGWFYWYLSRQIYLPLFTVVCSWLPIFAVAALSAWLAGLLEPDLLKTMGNGRLLVLGTVFVLCYGAFTLLVLWFGQRYWVEYRFVWGLIAERVERFRS